MVGYPENEEIKAALDRCKAIEAEAKEKIRAEHEKVLELINVGVMEYARMQDLGYGEEKDEWRVVEAGMMSMFSMCDLTIRHTYNGKRSSKKPFHLKDWDDKTVERLTKWLHDNFPQYQEQESED